MVFFVVCVVQYKCFALSTLLFHYINPWVYDPKRNILIMQDTKLILEVVEENWPIEYEAISSVRIQEMVENPNDYKLSTGSSNIDLAIVMAVIASGLSIVKSFLEIYFLLKKELGHVPTPEQMTQAVLKKTKEAATLGESKLIEIATSIIKRLTQ